MILKVVDDIAASLASSEVNHNLGLVLTFLVLGWHRVISDAQFRGLLLNLPLYVMLKVIDVLRADALRQLIDQDEVNKRVFEKRHPMLDQHKVEVSVLVPKVLRKLLINGCRY
jgi:hypothetical protein